MKYFSFLIQNQGRSRDIFILKFFGYIIQPAPMKMKESGVCVCVGGGEFNVINNWKLLLEIRCSNHNQEGGGGVGGYS